MQFDARITVYVGNFGSGKTELSIHTALALAKHTAPGRVGLVDLDIVNPYFKASSQTGRLQDAGVEVIAPMFANTGVDLPTLSPQVAKAFSEDAFDRVVMDVAGENAGARVLGRYAGEFMRCRDQVRILYVINAYRPDMSDARRVVAMLRHIEARSGLRVDALVNNANLAAETTGEDLLYGDAVVQSVARETGLRVAFAAGRPAVLRRYRELGGAYDGVEFTPVLRPDWLDNTR